jgi:hypothetical protein
LSTKRQKPLLRKSKISGEGARRFTGVNIAKLMPTSGQAAERLLQVSLLFWLP